MAEDSRIIGHSKIAAERGLIRTRRLDSPFRPRQIAFLLTAWGRIGRLDRFDEQRIVAFIEAYRGRDSINHPHHVE